MHDNNSAVLVIGGDSYIGKSLACYLEEQSTCVLSTSRRKNSKFLYLDLASNELEHELRHLLNSHTIDAAVVLAAITGEGQCAANQAHSEFINVEQTQKILSCLHNKQVFSVFMSTSMVFNHLTAFIKPDTIFTAKTIYGRQKAAVEQFIEDNALNTAVLRAGKVIGAEFALFDNLLSPENSTVTLFDDHYAAPISLTYLCKVIHQIIVAKVSGIYQCSGDEDISYAEMAKRIVARLDLPIKIKGISATEKGVKPERFGSLQNYCSANFEMNNQHFTQVIEDYLHSSCLFSQFLNQKD